MIRSRPDRFDRTWELAAVRRTERAREILERQFQWTNDEDQWPFKLVERNDT